MVFGPKNECDSLNFFSVDILENKISPTDKVRNLGVIFDAGFTFSDQVNSIRKSCFYYIHDFARIWRHLSKSTAIALANMPWSAAGLITVTHFCPVYLSKIFIVFRVFKILLVRSFVDFLVSQTTKKRCS